MLRTCKVAILTPFFFKAKEILMSLVAICNHCSVFDLFELVGGESAGGELFLGLLQLRWPEEAADYVSVKAEHVCVSILCL